MELEWVGMVEEDGYNKTSWIFILLILLSVADQGVWVLLAETEGDVEAVLLGDLPVELPDRGHTSVSTAGVNTPSLDRLQIWSEVDSISLTCNWERGRLYLQLESLSHLSRAVWHVDRKLNISWSCRLPPDLCSPAGETSS